MLISCNKLKSYIKDSNDIDFLNIWKTFTIRTAEVEGVKEVGKNIDGVVVAKIVSCELHPDSDHMHVLMVECGEKEPIQVVCGAPNVKEGLKTALVKVGGHIEGIEITARPLRGVVSNGMCLSGKELGISDDHSGIIELPDDYEVGKSLKELWPIEDIIAEIDNKSLTNRPDLWGHYGIAREIAAITGHKLLPLDVLEIKNDKKDLEITIKDPELCYRYCGLTIDNLKNNKTPMDMQIFLYYAGMRSINLLVDVTNYLMLELGQPMHAFDKRVVTKIEVGKANDGDTYDTLDGTTRKLTSDNLMIKNGDKYFGIAGVMGGLDSEILPDTTSIFVESACFNAGSIRKTAVSLGLRTEASARYEKSLDPNMTDKAIKRLAYILKKENPDMEITSNLTDVYPTKLDEITINLTKKKLNSYMGTQLDNSVVKSILESIEFKVKETKDAFEVTVPTFRHSKDINIEEDLIEEIARLYGLENIEAKTLKLDLNNKELETIYNSEYEAKYFLASKFDLNEVNSYLWYDTALLKDLNLDIKGVKLLGKENNNILRDNLPLSLLNIVKEDLKNTAELKIFEIATTIENNTPHRHLAIMYAIDEKKTESMWNQAKATIKSLFKSLKNINVEFIENVNEKLYYDNNVGKKVVYNNTTYGEINIFKKSYISKIAKKKSVIAIDIDFDLFADIKPEGVLIKDLSKYPVVNLDYTLIATKDTKYQNIKDILNEFKDKIINSYKLSDIYEDENNKKYTISFVVGSNEKTLTQEELNTFKESFIAHIKKHNLSIIE